MKTSIERALNLRPGDLGRGALLSSCLFLVITTYIIGKVAGAALFLSRFHARQLAYADIASAALVAMVVVVYVMISRRVRVRNLLVGSMCFFSLVCLLFGALAHYRAHLSWLFPAFYIWVKIVGVLAPAQMWTLANYVLTTREAKRVFGMVGGGAIVGWIFAGFLSKVIAKAFGTESLLLVMAAFLAICGGLVVVTWRYEQGHLAEPSGTAGAQVPAPNLANSLGLVFSSRYLRAIAAVICISSFITTLTGWQFLAIAQQFLITKDALAVFFGNFNFYAGVLSLLFQLLVTTRLVRRFGIGTSLSLLPFTILLGSIGLLIFGTLAAAVALRSCDQVLRYSIDKSTTELLYLPIPTRIKLRVKWFIDTVIWRMGDALAGFTVLIFATALRIPARQISWITLFLVSGWITAVFVARREYILTLKENIAQHKIEAEQIPTLVLDRSSADLLASKISTSDPKEILYALSLLEADKRVVHPVVRSLLSHPVPEIRSKAIVILSDAGDTTARPDIERLLHDTDLNVRTDALLYLTHNAHIDPLQLISELSDFADFSVRSAVVAFLGRPGETQNMIAAREILAAMVNEGDTLGPRSRVEVARLIGELPDCFDPLLSTLLADTDKAVVAEAMRSVGKLRKRRLVPDLLDRLADPELRAEAAKALAEFGDTIVGSLRDHLGDSSVAIEVRRAIPVVLFNVATPAAERALMENLLDSDPTLRFSTIRALNKLHRLHPEIAVDVQMVETVLAAEILGHYRSFQILNSLQVDGHGEPAIGRALEKSMGQEIERIFRLLALLHPHLDLHAAHLGLQSKNASAHDNALEFLDNVLKGALRDMLLPLLDGRVTVAERAHLANRLVRTKIATREEAVATLVSSEDPWLKSCGAYAIGSLGIKSLEGELERCLNDSDPLLRETARAAKEQLAKAAPEQPSLPAAMRHLPKGAP